jgi:ligand-binding sensor domain-containing protein
LWVGTSGGLALFKDNRFSSYTTESGLANNIIWSIEEDDAGSLWLGTDGGLVKFKDGKIHHLYNSGWVA